MDVVAVGNDQLLERQIERLVLEDDLFAELGREFGQFCPFEAMGIVNAEIRHGTFLSRMIDPHVPHGFGGHLLRALIMSAIKVARTEIGTDIGVISPLDIHLLDFDDALVHREWRNIDIVIDCPRNKLVIAIELKINSKQSYGQLNRYRSTINSEESFSDYKKLFIFLTKNEELPEEFELPYWIPLSLGRLVDEFDLELKSHRGDPVAKDMLKAYLKMLRREHVKNERLEKLVSELWGRHGAALSYLAERRPDALANLMDMVGQDQGTILKALNSAGPQNWEGETPSPTIVRFAYKPWDNIPGFDQANWTDSSRFILFEIKREGNCVSGCLYLGPGPEAYREPIAAKIRSHKLAHPKNRFGSSWACLAKKKWLFDASLQDDFDLDAARLQIKDEFVRFALESVSHFDKHLSNNGLVASELGNRGV